MEVPMSALVTVACGSRHCRCRPRPRQRPLRRGRRRARRHRPARRAGARRDPSRSDDLGTDAARRGTTEPAAATEATSAAEEPLEHVLATGRGDPDGGRRHGAVAGRRPNALTQSPTARAVAAALCVELTVVDFDVVMVRDFSSCGVVGFFVLFEPDLVAPG